VPKHSTSIPRQTRAEHRAPEHADTAVLELLAELGLLEQPPGRRTVSRSDVAAAR
jgi:hypothetical protein